MATAKLDAVLAASVDEARAAAEEAASVFGVGEHLGCSVEDCRVVSHRFACPHPGYVGWYWSVTMARASRAKAVTVNEVELLPGEGSLLAPRWVPWEERIQAGDVQPGVLMPTPADDPRLEPGYTGGEAASDDDPAEATVTRAVVAELGLGRERVLSDHGRTETAERWLDGQGGPDNAMAHQAPAPCATCGYFVRLQGRLGAVFGACTNEYSPSDGRIVAVDHGCGGHSDVHVETHGVELPLPVWDTISVDKSLFD